MARRYGGGSSNCRAPRTNVVNSEQFHMHENDIQRLLGRRIAVDIVEVGKNNKKAVCESCRKKGEIKNIYLGEDDDRGFAVCTSCLNKLCSAIKTCCENPEHGGVQYEGGGITVKRDNLHVNGVLKCLLCGERGEKSFIYAALKGHGAYLCESCAARLSDAVGEHLGKCK